MIRRWLPLLALLPAAAVAQTGVPTWTEVGTADGVTVAFDLAHVVRQGTRRLVPIKVTGPQGNGTGSLAVDCVAKTGEWRHLDELGPDGKVIRSQDFPPGQMIEPMTDPIGLKALTLVCG